MMHIRSNVMARRQSILAKGSNVQSPYSTSSEISNQMTPICGNTSSLLTTQSRGLITLRRPVLLLILGINMLVTSKRVLDSSSYSLITLSFSVVG